MCQATLAIRAHATSSRFANNHRSDMSGTPASLDIANQGHRCGNISGKYPAIWAVRLSHISLLNRPSRGSRTSKWSKANQAMVYYSRWLYIFPARISLQCRIISSREFIGAIGLFISMFSIIQVSVLWASNGVIVTRLCGVFK